MGRCFAKHSMTSSKVCSSVRTGAIAGVFTYATSKQMLSMVGGSLNLRRLKFKAIRDGIPLWRKVFDLLTISLQTITKSGQEPLSGPDDQNCVASSTGSRVME